MAYTQPVLTTVSPSLAQFQADGLDGLVLALIAANLTPTANPTAAPTLSQTGSGGTLPAGNYYATVTETNGIGETTTGAQVSSVQAITLGQDLVVTFQTLKSGNTARNVYVGNNSAGPFTRAGTGITASTFTISAPLPSNSYATGPPATNGTALTAMGRMMAKKVLAGQLQQVYGFAAQGLRNFNSGAPESFTSVIQKLRDAHNAIAIISAALTAAGTAIDANPGTLRQATTGIGGSTTVRTQP